MEFELSEQQQQSTAAINMNHIFTNRIGLSIILVCSNTRQKPFELQLCCSFANCQKKNNLTANIQRLAEIHECEEFERISKYVAAADLNILQK